MKRDKAQARKILKTLKRENSQFIKLCFVDIPGSLKSITISKSELPDPVEANIFDMDSTELKASKINTLPGSFSEALGDHFFEKFPENKKIERDLYHTHVTDFEAKRYLSTL